jgi:acetylornithine deacetylase/succinyl-diaminopimelate desuccinylase-like protein
MSQAFDHASEHMQEAIDELVELLRIPSISALPEHGPDTRRAADFMAAALRRAGMENVHLAEPESGYPVVRGDWLGAPGKPTLILYGHYDVQPPDPVEEWTTPPFEPGIRDGRIYARGASDNKGQVMAIIKGVEAVMKTEGRLPINVKFAIEGEEESGGKALPNYLRDHAEEMKADAVLVADSNFPHPDVPGILTGLRGLVYTEVEAQGAAFDLHSGQYGGAAPNPFNALALVIAGLKDSSGRITIPGFYDDVIDPTPEEVESWGRLGFDEQEFLRTQIGSDAYFGEPDWSVPHRLMSRPTLDVHGIRGGFTGEGAKTVIPARAVAKISMRLVPNQDPGKIFAAFERRVQELATPGTRLVVRAINTDPPVSASIDGRGVQACKRALERAFGKEAAFLRMGGSVPVCTVFQEALGVELVITGFGLADDRLHSPDEKYEVSQYEGGIKTTIAMLEELGA